jgi:hypothetical protein
MLSFEDERWAALSAGYHVPVDLRPLLRALESATDVRPAWDALWQALYHQGDVGEGSFVAVPHLVPLPRRGVVDWNTLFLSRPSSWPGTPGNRCAGVGADRTSRRSGSWH